MKILIAFVLLICPMANAETCKDSDQGINPLVAGKVVYSLGDQNCIGSDCLTQVFKEYDRCLDEKKVLEFSCRAGKAVETELNCSADQICRAGICVKK